MKLFAKTLTALCLVTSLGLVTPAQAHHDDYEAAFSSLGLTMITFLPTIITEVGTIFGQCDHDRDCDIPFKAAYVKATAIEAAEYMAGGAMGPNLEGFIKANPRYTPDQLIDGVLEVAERL